MYDPIRKYSKSSNFYASSKKEFFGSNDDLLAKAKRQNELYAKGPARLNCKICGDVLLEETDIKSHGVEYVFCRSCNHLNGRYDDTQDFVNSLYVADGGTDYANNYIDSEYASRAEKIYIPKAEFLKDSLPRAPTGILDVGCGGGYFVYAAQKLGFASLGIDVSETMTAYGNSQIKNHLDCEPLHCVDETELYEAVRYTAFDVVSAIGVIEHLREPERFFEAVKKSKASFLYYSVPMFSPSVFLENAMQDIFPRQLSGGHTHLFTEESLLKMHELVRGTSIAEWRFGTDMMDLYRSLVVAMQKNGGSSYAQDQISRGMGGLIDELQNILDKNHFCSEIHVLVSCANSRNG